MRDELVSCVDDDLTVALNSVRGVPNAICHQTSSLKVDIEIFYRQIFDGKLPLSAVGGIGESACLKQAIFDKDQIQVREEGPRGAPKQVAGISVRLKQYLVHVVT